MIGLCFSYLQGAGFQSIPLLLSEVQSCQVGSPWSIAGVGKVHLWCPSSLSSAHLGKPRLSLLRLGRELGRRSHPIWAESSHPGMEGLYNGVKRPNDSGDNSDDGQSDPLSSPGRAGRSTWVLRVFSNFPRRLQISFLISEYRNAEKENCKIEFRYYLFSKNTTNLPVTGLGHWFRGASSACG